MSKSIAIIGAGLSGAVLYKKLKQKNYQVTVFEKSRGAGGRCSSRYIKELKIDHGTSSFQAQEAPFKEFCQEQVKAGYLIKEDNQYKGVDGINQMVSSQIAKNDLITRSRIIASHKVDSKWILEDEDQKIYSDFDIILCTIPTPQVLDLQVDSIEDIKTQLKDVSYDSVATLIAYGGTLQEDQIKKLETNSFFRKISVQKDAIVFHTIAAIANQLDSKEEVKKIIVQEIESTIGIDISVTMNLIPHLWKYGFVSNSLDQEYIYDEKLQFGVCGDYFKGDNLGASFLSSNALANRI